MDVLPRPEVKNCDKHTQYPSSGWHRHAAYQELGVDSRCSYSLVNSFFRVPSDKPSIPKLGVFSFLMLGQHAGRWVVLCTVLLEGYFIPAEETAKLDYFKTLFAIASDIEALKSEFPQLKDFTPARPFTPGRFL
jgi:hypothetical protein